MLGVQRDPILNWTFNQLKMYPLILNWLLMSHNLFYFEKFFKSNFIFAHYDHHKWIAFSCHFTVIKILTTHLKNV